MLDMFQRIALTPIQFAGQALKELDDLSGGQIDQQLGRAIHKAYLSKPISQSDELSSKETNSHVLLVEVENALEKGKQLKTWLESKHGQFANQFPVVRRFNLAESSYGFYDKAYINGSNTPVMGIFEEFSFDRVRSENLVLASANLREFVLKYLLRISDYRLPKTVVNPGAESLSSRLFKPLSWCSYEGAEREGFGYEQLMLKRYGKVESTNPPDRFEIQDLRKVVDPLDWLLLNVEIFDFNFSWQPFGASSAELVLPIRQSSYLVVSPEFLTDEPTSRAADAIAEFGIGYAFVRNPGSSLLAYGPGQFDAAIKLINFRLLRSGEIKVQMSFVANRPKRVSVVPLNPINWLSEIAKALPTELARPLESLLPRTNVDSPISIDPVYLYVDVLDAATCGYAKRNLCVSREQLEKLFLARHYQQHYQMIVGALSTWRNIPDWTNESRIPKWVRSGVSS